MSRRRDAPDEVLVVAAILGDLDAFGELVRRYRPAVVRTAEAVVGRAEAEDVAQDALLLAFKALPSIEDPSRFAAWLVVVARHRALRVARQAQRRREGRVPLDEALLERLDVRAALPPVREEDGAVRRALDGLPPDYALALRLRFFDDMPLRRIAAALGVPVSTVKWRLHRGRQLLREHLQNTEDLSWNAKKKSPSS